MDVEQSIYRIIELQNGIPTVLGTASYVEGGFFFTCWHVLQAHSQCSTAHPPEESFHTDQNTYLLGGSPEPIYNITWQRHHDKIYNQYYDFAVGRLPPGAIEPARLPISIETLNSDQKDLICKGYGEEDPNQLGTRIRNYAGYEAQNGRYQLDNALAPGFSGSPVFCNGAVVAVAAADNINRSLAYCIPINCILHWVERTFELSVPQTTPAHNQTYTPEQIEIAKYPIAIHFDTHEIPIEALIEILLSRRQSIEEIKVSIRECNQNLSLVSNLNQKNKLILIDIFDISESSGPRSYARDVFLQAIRKSSRTVAALIEAEDIFSTTLLTSEQSDIVTKTKQLLRKPKTD
ncbi:MAG: hypothetical protein ACI8WB_005260 [Phenylobacterium sp.]|jgi:hypothetical protein